MQRKNADEDTVLPSWSFTQTYKNAVRGVAPQHLIDTATRHNIYKSVYWNQYCFGVNLVTLVDRAQNLKGIGGVYGMFREPCNFICLFLKLLELEPSKEVIHAFLNAKAWQMKYLKLLAALYVRFVYPAEEVYLILEDMMKQYFKIAVLREDGYKVEHFDEVIYSFLNDRFWCGIQFPPLTPRVNLPPRDTPLIHMEEDLRVEEFEKLGLTPEGELIEEIEKKREKEKKKGKLQFKVTKRKKEKKAKDPEAESIEEENKLRAMLGIPLLK